MKTCFKCEKAKPLGDFYKHSMMADGHLGKCKECAKVDVKQNRKQKLDYYRNYDRKRLTENHKRREYHKSKSKKWQADNPEKRAAHMLVLYAIRSGKIIKPNLCSCCNEEKSGPRQLHAHHEDYTKPLDVIWLCPECHVHHHKMGKQP